MEMCYDGALVMPSSYAVMDEEEMTYLDGGIYFTNRQVQSGVYAFMSACVVNPMIVSRALTKFANVVSKVAARVLSWIGRVFGGVVGGVIGHIVGAWTGWSIAFSVGKALIYNKGIEVGWGGLSVR